MAWSTWVTISSVVSTAGVTNVVTPQVRASWLRMASMGVNASSGSSVCRRASRRTVSPELVNATNAFALIRSPMSRAAKEITPWLVRGIWVSGGTATESASTASMILLMVRTVWMAYFPTGVSPGDLHGPFLHEGHLFEGEFDAEVAAGHHDAVEGEHDGFEVVDGFWFLDLGDDRDPGC